MGKFPESILWIILVITTLLSVASLVHSHQIQYPNVKRDESIVDDYHGTKVRDPYRWLEERDSEQVSEFVGTQNELTSTYLSDCKQRRKFNESLTELWAYPKYGLPEKRGSRYFYFAQQSGGEVLHVLENKESAPRVLLNREQNRVLAFPSFGVSRNGELIVYKEVLTAGAGDSENLRILNVSSGNVYPEVLHDVKNPQVAWDKGSRGFFYFSHRKNEKLSAEEDENSSPNIYYHRVGTKVDSDVLAVTHADFENEPNFVDMETSVDGDFLLLRTRSYDETRRALKTNSTFYIVNLAKFQETEAVGVTERLQLVPVITKRSTAFLRYVTNTGTLFYFRSRIGNKNYKLIKIDLTDPSEANWRVVVDENINYVLQGATAVDKSKVVLSYTSDKLSSYAELRDLENGSLIRMFELDHSPYKLLSFSGHIDDSEVLFRSTKLEGLPELFYFDVRDPKGPMKRLVQPPTLSRYDPSAFVSQVVTYPSEEGESVEMILLHRKDLKRDGSAFTFITERDFTLDFYFGTYLSLLKDFNAVVAFPHLKEKGSGFRDSSLDDFIGAAKYLVEHGYSNGSRIITRGEYTFGLFVASAVNKIPGLYGAALPSLAAFDMLRFDVATNSTAGLTEDLEEFKRSYGISPLHNIHLSPTSSQYPGIFVTTSNVYPIHLAFKYLAQLQYTLGQEVRQTNPFLMRVVPEPAEPTDPGFAKYHIHKEIEIRCFLEKTVGLELI